MPFLRLLRHLLPLLWVATSAAAEEAPPHRSFSAEDVRLTRTDDGFRIEASMIAPVPLEIAWQVLTDFDHMARFVPNLERSLIIERTGNFLRIEQQGKAWFGPFPVVFGSTREVELQPMREIRARQITGTAKSMNSAMRFSAVPEGTQLEYRADVVPDTYLPPLFGPGAVRRETAGQFSAILLEMRTRAGAGNR